jgi:hypothetical protein
LLAAQTTTTNTTTTTHAPTTKAPTITTTKAPTSSPSTQAPTTITATSGNYKYILVTSPKRVPLDAEADCQQRGGHLASITGPTLNSFLLSTFASTVQDYWIGLKKVNGQYQWIDGQTTTYRNWNSNQPDNTFINSVFINSGSTSGKWRTNSTTQKLNYLCKVHL